MKKLIYNLLFVMTIMIVSVIGINKAKALQASCTYVGEVEEVGDYSFTIQLSDQGKLTYETPKFNRVCNDANDRNCTGANANWYDPNISNSLKLNANFSASMFEKDGDLVTSCPEVYLTTVVKKSSRGTYSWYEVTLFMGDTNSKAKSTIKESDNLTVSTTKKMSLTQQILHRKDKFYIDGKVVNDKKPLTCDYQNDNGDKMTIKNVGGKVWVDSISLEPSTYSSSITNFKDQGDLTDKGCVLNLYASCGEEKTGYHCTISKNKSGVFNRSFTAKRDLTESDDIELITGDLTVTDGCEMFQSLNSLIKEIFTFLQIAGVILVIVLGMLDFLKAVSLGEQDTIKKAFSKTVKRILIVIILFLLPVLIDWILGFFDITETCLEVVK